MGLSLGTVNNANADREMKMMHSDLQNDYAVEEIEQKIKKDLKKGKLAINYQNRDRGNTLLHLAAKKGSPEIVKLLLQHPKINREQQNNNGETPLFKAIETKVSGAQRKRLLKLLFTEKKLQKIKPKNSNKRFLSAALIIDQRDEQEEPEDVMTRKLAAALFDQACTIVTTGSLLNDLLFIHTNSPYKKDNYFLTEELLKMHSFYAIVKQKDEKESEVPFVCVIIPHAYEKKIIDDWDSCKELWGVNRKGLTEKDIALGINFGNLRKLSTREELESFCFNKKNRNNKIYLKALGRIFVQRKKIPIETLKRTSPKKLIDLARKHFYITERDYPATLAKLLEKLERPHCGGVWNFYQTGHGGLKTIANLPAAEYKEELAFFKNKIDTNFLMNSTCFKQSHVFSAYQQTKKMQHTKADFTIVNRCTTEGPTTSIIPNHKQLFSDLEHREFSLETKQKKRLSIKEIITNAHPSPINKVIMNSNPFVRHPNSIYFIPLQINEKVEYLTHAKTKGIEYLTYAKHRRHKADFEEKRPKISIPETKDFVFISPSRIALPLQFSSPYIEILSTFPGNALHLIDELDMSDLSEITPESLEEALVRMLFSPAQKSELKSQKIFIIKTIRLSKKIFNNIIVVINPTRSDKPDYKIIRKDHFAQLAKAISKAPFKYYQEKVEIDSKSARKPMFAQPFLAGQKTYKPEIINFASLAQSIAWQNIRPTLEENNITAWDLFWANFDMTDPQQFKRLQKVSDLKSKNARELQIRVEAFLKKIKKEQAKTEDNALKTPETMEKYLEQLSYINQQDGNGQTLLHKAAKEGNLDIVKLLIERGAGFNIRDNNNQSPHKIAKNRKNNSLIEFFENLVSCASATIKGDTQAMNDAFKKFPLWTKIKDKDGYSLAHAAAKFSKNVNSITQLLKHGISFKEKDSDGNTPFHIVAKKGKVEFVRELLKHPDKVDIYEKNNAGKTALDLVAKKNKEDED